MANTKPQLEVIVKSRTKTLFNGKAYSVSSVNDKGPFDVLPHHANFITLIKGFLVIDDKLPTKKDIPVDRGVLSTANGVVNIYLGF